MYKLTAKDVKKANLTYLFFHHSAQNYERMMGLAFCHVLSEPLSKLYENKDDYIKALRRHIQFYNSEPTLGSVIPGIVLALEEQKANGGDNVTEDLIIGVKNSLMGPLAGIGDSLIGATYRTIIMSIAISLAADGSILGALFALLFDGIALTLAKYTIFNYGYKVGLNAVKLITPEITEALTTTLGIIGLIVVGGITANMVNIPIKFVFTSGEMTLSIQAMLDKIMPGILSLLLPIGLWLLYRKGWSPAKALLVIVAVVLLSTVIGIM